jgi:hypothetical protein
VDYISSDSHFDLPDTGGPTKVNTLDSIALHDKAVVLEEELTVTNIISRAAYCKYEYLTQTVETDRIACASTRE